MKKFFGTLSQNIVPERHLQERANSYKNIHHIYIDPATNPYNSFIAPRTAFVKSCVVLVPPMSGVRILLEDY